MKSDFVDALNSFYDSYVVETVDGTFQIFRSFTYGEITISLLLFSFICLFTMKWLWEVFR